MKLFEVSYTNDIDWRQDSQLITGNSHEEAWDRFQELNTYSLGNLSAFSIMEVLSIDGYKIALEKYDGEWKKINHIGEPYIPIVDVEDDILE